MVKCTCGAWLGSIISSDVGDLRLSVYLCAKRAGFEMYICERTIAYVFSLTDSRKKNGKCKAKAK